MAASFIRASAEARLAGSGLVNAPLLRESGNAIPASDQDELRRLGAIGDVCLRFFGENGEPVMSELDARIVGIPADLLLGVPRRIGVAGGTRKHSAIKAALLGGWVNVLITDSDTAMALVGDWVRPESAPQPSPESTIPPASDGGS